MVWDDVVEFYEAIESDPPRAPDQRPVLTKDNGLLAAGELHRQRLEHHGLENELDVSTISANPLDQLFAYLSDPRDEAWTRLAKSATAGLAAGKEPDTEPDMIRFKVQGASGLPVDLALDISGEKGANAERWRARLELDDTEQGVEGPEHKGRWQEWLWWSNLLQFLDRDGCEFSMEVKSAAGSSIAKAEDAPTGVPGSPAETSDIGIDIDLVDEGCQELLREALAAGVPAPEIGFELESGDALEVAWPEVHVAIIIDGQPTPTGWDARPADNWDVKALLQAVGDSTS
jgi:hypothetical protein